MNTNFPVCGILVELLIVVRCLLDKNEDLIIILATINLIAAAVVIYSIYYHIKTNIMKILKCSSGLNELKNLQKPTIEKRVRIIKNIAFISFAIFALIYMIFFISNLGNDIISISALGLSLSDSFISDLLTKKCIKR